MPQRSRSYALIAILLALLLLDRAIVLAGFAFRYTDQDQTLLWYTAREVLAGRWHEPAFHGQAYSPPVEAWLAAPLMACGASPWTALPAVSALLGIAPYLVLSVAALRKRLTAAAAVLLAVPLLMPVEYSMVTSMPRGFLAGIAAGSVACAMWLYAESRWSQIVAGAMAMVGLTLLPNALLLVAPVAIFAVIRHARDRGFWLRSALGALAAMPLPVAIAWFYAAHPQRVVHNPMPLAFSVSQLGRALADLSVPLGHFVPIIDAGWPVLAGLTALVVVLCVRRDWPVAAAGAAGLVLLVGSLGVTRVELDLHSVFFPASRYYLAVPVLGAVLAAQVAQTASGRLGLAARLPTAAVVLLLACAIGLVVRSASLDAATERALAKTYPVFVARVDELRVLSRELAVAAESCDADLVLVSDYPLLVFNYGVPVLTDGRVETLFPTYERRTWRLAHETRAVRPRMMVMTGGRPDIERNLQRLGAQRLAQLPGLWCVEAGGRTPLEIARLAGIEVRDRGIDPTTVPVP